jgi:hypothetical protein
MVSGQGIPGPGGRIAQALYDGRRTAIDRMAGECADRGGHGIVGAAVQVREIPANSFTAGAVEFTVIGTAVRASRSPPLARAGEIEIGSIGLLAELGHPQQGFVDEIGARMPNAREFDFFKLASGTPVIVVNRTSYSTDRPIRLTRYIYRADRVRLLHVEGKVPEDYRHD